MASERKSIRVTVLVEDKRQERFVRELLLHLGFDSRKLRFDVAPSGEGAAEAWVRKRYPGEVKVLRSKIYQKDLSLLAMRDGDAKGVSARKGELDDELAANGHAKRGASERISTPVPTWSIETWLLQLLGEDALSEDKSYKTRFPPVRRKEAEAIRAAVGAWPGSGAGTGLPPSLADGCVEIARLAQ